MQIKWIARPKHFMNKVTVLPLTFCFWTFYRETRRETEEQQQRPFYGESNILLKQIKVTLNRHSIQVS